MLEALLDPSTLVIDVRTPSEFAHGHIPGAVSIPLFSDDERAEVGTTYKQVSPRDALRQGLSLVGPKLVDYLDLYETALRERNGADPASDASGKPPTRTIIHCWRGGMRSASMAWLLRTAGYEVDVLEGGYKAYRSWVLSELERPWPFVVIGGRTGSGKTDILRALAQNDTRVIDLEAIANHRGSAFGSLMMPPQPSTEQAMNDLHHALWKLGTFDGPIFIEDESLRIGTVVLHRPFWLHMQASPLLVLDVPREERLDNLAAEYGEAPVDELRERFERIAKRLGGDRYKEAIAALERGDLHAAAGVALDYYDQTYDFGIARRHEGQVRWIDCTNLHLTDRCAAILQHLSTTVRTQ
jgi:tRNA 2-selenouridine synthase